MKITKIKLTNFRNFENFELEKLEKNNIILGLNGTGKTNLLYAIRKVLDLKERRKEMTSQDSFNGNNEKIEIELFLKTDDKADDRFTNYLRFFNESSEFPDSYTTKINLSYEYNHETDFYDAKLILGEVDQFEVSYSSQQWFDKIINILYVEPNFNLNDIQKDLLKVVRNHNILNDKTISDDLKNAIEDFKKIYSEDEIIKELNQKIHDEKENNSLKALNDNALLFEPEIDVSNIYSNMKISLINNGNSVLSIGHGKERLLSYILQLVTSNHKKVQDSEKEKFLIMLSEEPENNLFYNLQKDFLSSILDLKDSQIFVTTHSPKVVDISKRLNLIKLTTDSKPIVAPFIDAEEIGYLFNERIAQGLFYQKILLVEGESEFLFYSWLSEFGMFPILNEIYVLPILGINFKPYYDLYKNLKIDVAVKTDNDFYKFKHYGINRGMKLIGQNPIDETEDVDTIQKFVSDLQEEGIFLQSNVCKKDENIFGFENDMYEFLSKIKPDFSDNEAFVKKLRNAKQKNLFEVLKEFKDDNLNEIKNFNSIDFDKKLEVLKPIFNLLGEI